MSLECRTKLVQSSPALPARRNDAPRTAVYRCTKSIWLAEKLFEKYRNFFRLVMISVKLVYSDIINYDHCIA